MSRRRALWAAVLCAVCACHARHIDLARDLDPPVPDAGSRRDTGVIDARMPDLDGRVVAPMPDAGTHVPVLCGTVPCACDDGIDNDGDHLADGEDPECTGAFDRDEGSFATGGPSKAKNCRDCFWDEDESKGNDDCRYPSECLTGKAPNGKGTCSSCKVSDACLSTCAARTPSGCDCFGCCEVSRPDGTTLRIELSETCSMAKLDDPKACPRCVQSTQCRNPCGRCELCPGRTLRDLPADCVANDCEEGQPVCSTAVGCTTDLYCQQGCCFRPLL